METKTDSIKSMTLDYLNENARYLHVAIPYCDKKDEDMMTFYDESLAELDYDEKYVNRMLNKDHQKLEWLLDLQELKAIDWASNNMILWGKICDEGTYTLLDTSKKPIWQIKGYVPNKLLPPYEEGWGDYLELVILSDGSLMDWRKPLDFKDFIEDGKAPRPILMN